MSDSRCTSSVDAVTALPLGLPPPPPLLLLLLLLLLQYITDSGLSTDPATSGQWGGLLVYDFATNSAHRALDQVAAHRSIDARLNSSPRPPDRCFCRTPPPAPTPR
ncbi:MAG: hypothetical protein ACK41Y_16790, partial [Paracoccus hibiscisoli]|uniref:hypothetical protein n=1 Tax=Paracoccus hibiscisoli TaxID=2023261 RepID=UPI00391CB84D